jgi:hypothetical protein
VNTFLHHICGVKVSERLLEARSAIPAGPQGTAELAGPGQDNLAELERAINKGKEQIGAFGRFVARTKAFFSGSDFQVELDKQVFSKIIGTMQSQLLELTLQCAVPSRNPTVGIAPLLDCCKNANVDANDILKAWQAITDSSVRGLVAQELARLESGFNLGGLKNLGTSAAKTLVELLSLGGEGGAAYLKLLLEDGKLNSLVEFDASAAKDIALGLAGAGPNGAECLDLLLENKLLGGL